MRLFDLFTEAPTISAEEARRRLDSAKAGEVTLIDVREPAEYERGHIPGAMLMPMSTLPDKLGELDAGKPIIVY